MWITRVGCNSAFLHVSPSACPSVNTISRVIGGDTSRFPKHSASQLLGIISILFIIVVELPYGARIELHLMEVEVYERLNELEATFQPEEQEIEYSCDFS